MQYTVSQIKALHKKYAPSDTIYELVLIHSQIVCDIADQLMSNGAFEVDADLVRIGSLLHDIGVHRMFDRNGNPKPGVNYLTHGIVGEEILRAEGVPESIWRFCSHHTGVGISRGEIVANKLPLPEKDYYAETDEELLVMYADKFHSKTTPPYFINFEWYKEYVSRFGSYKVKLFRDMANKFGIPELEPLSKKYGFMIRSDSPSKIEL